MVSIDAGDRAYIIPAYINYITTGSVPQTGFVFLQEHNRANRERFAFHRLCLQTTAVSREAGWANYEISIGPDLKHPSAFVYTALIAVNGGDFVEYATHPVA